MSATALTAANSSSLIDLSSGDLWTQDPTGGQAVVIDGGLNTLSFYDASDLVITLGTGFGGDADPGIRLTAGAKPAIIEVADGRITATQDTYSSTMSVTNNVAGSFNTYATVFNGNGGFSTYSVIGVKATAEPTIAAITGDVIAFEGVAARGTYGQGDIYGAMLTATGGYTGTSAYGIHATATGGAATDVAYGIWATATTADTNWAGYFVGDVNITGTLTAATLKTRQCLSFGYNAIISATSGTTTVDAHTVDGSANAQGYRMIRAGTVTGVSLQFDVTNASTEPAADTFIATVQKNGANQSMAVTVETMTSTGDYGAQSTSTSFTMAAGDTINVELSLTEDTGDQLNVENVAVIVEITT